ncbi:MAG: AbrB/MazE/SpoVT family DNA-binding domain-containing protein [Nitrospirae bacterium]|nr:AbrB/MazE/SpoVT family DNA-binding domain-containing protein [Nitrospirota bacterium]
MSLVKVKNKFQIVIPDDVRKSLRVEIGDTLDIVEKDGVLIVKPVIVVDKAQAYFWSEEWQTGEKEAEAAKKAGDLKEFDDAAGAIKWLRD